MNVYLSDEQEDLSIDPTSVHPIVEHVLQCEGRKTEEVSISFVNADTMCELHAEFFDDPTLTDCISFPIDDEMLGDVVVCPAVALAFDDPYEETTLYLVHGLLHLIGYDDIEEEEKKAMRAAEKRNMITLQTHNLFLRP